MKRTYVYDGERKEMVEVTDKPVEWINSGVRYGSETLAQMKAKGLVPPSDFKETWARAAAERAMPGGTPAMKRQRVADVRDSIAKVRAGYKPNRRESL